MFSRMRILQTFVAVGACLVATFCFSGVATAEMSASVWDTPAVQALTRSPMMQKALAAAHKGDIRTASESFHVAARQGNPSRSFVLGRMYYEGRGGVARSYGESIKWLRLVIARHEEPARSLAADTLQEMSTALEKSPNQNDKMAGVAAGVAPFFGNPNVQRFLKNYGENMAHSIILTCFGMFCM
jgi:hypothetical protein